MSPDAARSALAAVVPRTEAGKRLLDDLTPPGRDEAEHRQLQVEIAGAVVAIEAEAAEIGAQIERAAVLRLLEGATE